MNTDNPGQAALSKYFGLSYASWLTIPRVFLHAMPDDWQGKMRELLTEMNETFPNRPSLGTRVQVTDNNKLIKAPEWLNYRYPDVDFINSMRAENGEENLCN